MELSRPPAKRSVQSPSGLLPARKGLAVVRHPGLSHGLIAQWKFLRGPGLTLRCCVKESLTNFLAKTQRELKAQSCLRQFVKPSFNIEPEFVVHSFKPKKGSVHQDQTAAISPARRSAFEILRSVEQDSAYSSVLLAGLGEEIRTEDRALCHELVVGVLRRQLWLDCVIEHFANRKPE